MSQSMQNMCPEMAIFLGTFYCAGFPFLFFMLYFLMVVCKSWIEIFNAVASSAIFSWPLISQLFSIKMNALFKSSVLEHENTFFFPSSLKKIFHACNNISASLIPCYWKYKTQKSTFQTVSSPSPQELWTIFILSTDLHIPLHDQSNDATHAFPAFAFHSQSRNTISKGDNIII